MGTGIIRARYSYLMDDCGYTMALKVSLVLGEAMI